ncbi:MAG: type IV secretory system conjugative DNA transfer family protein [Litorimonas sp.]
MPVSGQTDKSVLIRSALVCGASLWALQALDPIYVYSFDLVTLGAVGAMIVCAPRLAAAALRWLAKCADEAAANIPDYIKGTARWGRKLSELGPRVLKPSLFKTGHGAFFGCLKKRGFFGLGRKPIVMELPAVTAVVGSTGSGKGILHQLINVLSVPGPKFIVDFDGTDTVMLANALRRKGERVAILNLGDRYHEQLGESDLFNPLDHIIDSFERADHGILDVIEDTVELANAILPESTGKDSENGSYFRDGSRDLLVLAILITVLVENRHATLDKVLSLLSDTDLFLKNLEWVCGELVKETGEPAGIDLTMAEWAKVQDAEDLKNFGIELANLARATKSILTAPDNRNYLSFLTGALQKLRAFNPATRASRKLQGSTFKFSDQKDAGPDLTVFIVLDSTKQNVQNRIMSLIMSIAQKEWVRHSDTAGKTITLFLNEINNWEYPDLRRALSWIRKFKLRCILYLQNFSNFDLCYGGGASEVLKSEAEIMLFLPEGLREPEILDFLESRLGNQSIIVRGESGHRTGPTGSGLDGYNYTEETKPLLTKDQVRRSSDRGILLVGNKPPFRPYLTRISQIVRFRRSLAKNPLYGKPFIEPMKLWLLRYEPWMPANIIKSIRGPKAAKVYQNVKLNAGTT